MNRDGKKEEQGKEVRGNLVCEKCNSAYVYVLANGQIICRRCGHRSPPKIKNG